MIIEAPFVDKIIHQRVILNQWAWEPSVLFLQIPVDVTLNDTGDILLDLHDRRNVR